MICGQYHTYTPCYIETYACVLNRKRLHININGSVTFGRPSNYRIIQLHHSASSNYTYSKKLTCCRSTVQFYVGLRNCRNSQTRIQLRFVMCGNKFSQRPRNKLHSRTICGFWSPTRDKTRPEKVGHRLSSRQGWLWRPHPFYDAPANLVDADVGEWRFARVDLTTTVSLSLA